MPINQSGSINTTALQVPDVYVQIVPPQPTLNGVSTNILGVVGTANWGPVNSPAIVSGPSDCAQQFGPMQPRKFDLGTAVYTASLQGAANFRCVRVTDGTDAAASATLGTGTGITFTGKYTGSLGNSVTVTVGTGTNSTTGAPTFKLTVNLPGQLSEVFDNIGGTGNALYVAMAAAINSGLSGLRGPSQLIVATAGAGTTAPTNPSTVTLSGGTDGATTITSSVLIGQDTVPRKGMYALRGTGASVGMLADADDTTQWTLQAAYGLARKGTYMVVASPAGDTISNFASTLATAGIDSLRPEGSIRRLVLHQRHRQRRRHPPRLPPGVHRRQARRSFARAVEPEQAAPGHHRHAEDVPAPAVQPGRTPGHRPGPRRGDRQPVPRRQLL